METSDELNKFYEIFGYITPNSIKFLNKNNLKKLQKDYNQYKEDGGEIDNIALYSLWNKLTTIDENGDMIDLDEHISWFSEATKNNIITSEYFYKLEYAVGEKCPKLFYNTVRSDEGDTYVESYTLDDILFNEADSADRDPLNAPIHLLFYGILFKGNWNYLCNKDLERFCNIYGIDYNEDDYRNEVFKTLIEKQGYLLKQILEFGKDNKFIRKIYSSNLK